MMDLDRTGIILYVLNYQECVQFYGKVLGLKVMFTAKDLTCFEFGNSYLMVELDDEYTGEIVPYGRQKTCIRMNVEDVKIACDELRALGIEVDYQEHSWGIIAKFFDPDGNLYAFKDSKKFENQVLSGK